MEYVIILDDTDNHRYFKIHLMRTKHHYKRLLIQQGRFLVDLVVNFKLLSQKHNKEEFNLC